ENVWNLVEYYQEAPGIVGGDKKKALQMAEDQIKSDPSNGYLAMVKIAEAEKDKAKIDLYSVKAAEANPKNYDAVIALAGRFINAGQPDWAAAEKWAHAANEVNPDRISAYRLLAYAVTMQGRYDEAAKIIARAEAA